jgi:hypothetical protein
MIQEPEGGDGKCHSTSEERSIIANPGHLSSKNGRPWREHEGAQCSSCFVINETSYYKNEIKTQKTKSNEERK